MSSRLRRTSLALAALVSSAIVAACGGSSSSGSATSPAINAAKQQLSSFTVDGVNGPLHPKSILCKNSSDEVDCTLTYPDGEKKECFVTGNAASGSTSCTPAQ